MPSTITHAYIGIDTIKKLDKKPQEILTKHLNNFKIYCQNMDVLYFYHILLLKENKVQKLGHIFHNENVFNYFNMLIQDNKKNQNLELFTFICGLIVHYQADSIMHPYIDFRSHNENKRKQTDKHFEIETYLDNYFIQKYEKQNYMKFNINKFIFNYKEDEIIKIEIDKLFKKYFHCSNMGNIYYHALKDMKFVFKYLRYDPTGIKRLLYSLLDFNPFNIRRTKYLSYHFLLNNNNYLNLEHQTWFNYENKNQVSNQSFLELYDIVTNNASYIINELYHYIFEHKKVNLKALIKNNSYSTGLPISPIQ